MAQDENSLQIIELELENVGRIQRVHVRPHTPVMRIGGQNGAGKSSLMKGIQAALVGKADMDEEPVRIGEDQSFSRVVLGRDGKPKYQVTRKCTAETGKATLKIESPEGASYPSPRKLLDELKSDFVDPNGFARMSRKERMALVEQLVPADWEGMRQRRAGLEEDKKEINRDLRDAERRASELPHHDDAPAEPMAEGHIATMQSEATAFHKSLAEWRAHRDSVATKAAEASAKIESLKRQIVDWEATHATLVDQGAKANANVEALSAQEPHFEALAERIQQSLEGERRYRANQEAKAAVAMAEEKRNLLSEKSLAIEACDNEHRRVLLDHPLPLDDLTMTPTGELRYKGVLFEQCAASEQIRIGLRIAMALSPILRVIFIADGSLLDNRSMAEVESFAASEEFQIWVERVGDPGPVGILLEDGEVARGPAEGEG